ncbi:MAG: hypothetical protein HY320_05135 [Armatimonadetes bacterium]|nr:hypothetical protein [Armatimonadota bacterium]
MRSFMRRGSALVTALITLFLLFSLGSSMLSLGVTALRRSHFDHLRTRALGLAQAGAETAIHFLRTTAPDGSTDGSWRTDAPYQGTVSGSGSFSVTARDGTGANAGKIILTSTGTAAESGRSISRTLRVVIKLDRENVNVWNNVVFGGVGQSGRAIAGNVVFRGNVHLLGDGEPFTDLDGDTRWDSGEPFTDQNGNGVYDLGEPYTDTDADGHYDSREPYDDVNGNGTRDPALTVTDLASEITGTASTGNNYEGMSAEVRDLVPPLPLVPYNDETVQSLSAKLRVKHGRVNVSGTATVGFPDLPGGSPLVKETMDGVWVTDGWGGNQGANNVYSDNGTRQKYNLGDAVRFPALTDPVERDGIAYASHMDYYEAQALVINSSLALKVGVAYGPVSDGRGNSLYVDATGAISIQGMVLVHGDINLNRGTQGNQQRFYYSGRGSLISTGYVSVHTDLVPVDSFPREHALGLIARRQMNIATGGGDSQLTLLGAFYAQEKVTSAKQNTIAGTFVSSYFEVANVPHMYQVPDLVRYPPPGLPGDWDIWITAIRIDSWREV